MLLRRTSLYRSPVGPLIEAAVPDEAPLTFPVEVAQWYGVTSDWETLMKC